MNQQLLQRLSVITDEEQRILNGEPLSQAAYTQGASFIVSGRKLLPPRQLITLRPHTRFTAFPLHCHDYVEILYMLSGKTEHDFPGQQPVSLQTGELLLINCHAMHSIRLCGHEDVGVNFIVQPAFFDDALAAIGSSNILGRFLIDALKRGEGAIPYLHFKVAENRPIQSLLESMLYSLTTEALVSQRVLKSSMALLFLHLLENTSQLSVPMSGGSALVVAVLDEIRNCYADICLRDIAIAHHVSPAYLSQTVHKATGESCTQLIQRQRITQAKRLLRETDLSIAEICSAVGYANTGHFYTLFEKLTGQSPQGYRKVNSGR